MNPLIASTHVSTRRRLGAIVAMAGCVAFSLLAAGPASADVPNPQLSAGAYSTCAISSARVYCWGSNSSSQLGLGSGAKVSFGTRPYPVKGVSAAPMGVSVGYSSGCSALLTGAISCWGRNAAGALGTKRLGGIARSAQVAATLIGPWAAPSNVASGAQHTCFRDNNSTVKCLGANNVGQLGNGTNASSATPLQVAVITGLTTGTRAVQVVSGANHSCALLANDNVKCWGVNNFRQLGTPTNTVPAVNSPVDVPNLANNISELASLADHTCALRSTGSVACWGADSYGQLGDGTVAPFKGPVTVDGLNGPAREVSTGVGHSCALVRGGAVQCWGSNEFGQLGNGTKITSAAPVSVIGLSRPATEISAGGYHTCARLDNAQIFCWGRGSKGQLGDGGHAASSTPRLVQAFGGLHFASVAMRHVATGGGSARSDFRATAVALPPRAGNISRQCRTSVKLTVTVLQDGVTTTKRRSARFRRSGKSGSNKAKCTARFSIRRITRSASPSTITLKGSYRGSSTMPGASFTQVVNLP